MAGTKYYIDQQKNTEGSEPLPDVAVKDKTGNNAGLPSSKAIVNVGDQFVITSATKYSRDLLAQSGGCFVVVSRRCYGIAFLLLRASVALFSASPR